jgi:hypothetical protein
MLVALAKMSLPHFHWFSLEEGRPLSHCSVRWNSELNCRATAWIETSAGDCPVRHPTPAFGAADSQSAAIAVAAPPCASERLRSLAKALHRGLKFHAETPQRHLDLGVPALVCCGLGSCGQAVFRHVEHRLTAGHRSTLAVAAVAAANHTSTVVLQQELEESAAAGCNW